MAKYGSADIRNVAFVGAPHSGKTTLLEVMLHSIGSIPRRGHVADGSSFVDYDALEKEKKHTLFMKVFHGSHKKKVLNLLDSPGYPDYVSEAIAAMNAVETVALSVNAAEGVQFHTQRLWIEAERIGRGRIILVNRCDAEGIDPEAVISSLQDILGSICQPINLPIAPGSGISGVVDLVKGHESAPAEMKELVASMRDQMIEGLVSTDDDAMEAYLESGEVAIGELAPLMQKGIASGAFVPILFTAAEKNVGVAELLDFLADDAPSPLSGPFFKVSDGAELTEDLHDLNPAEHDAFAGRVFKTVSDPYVGRLTFLRVVTGEIRPDDLYMNVRIGKHEKMPSVLRSQGKEHEKSDVGIAGDIVVVAKAETIETNDSLCAERAQVTFPPMVMPVPMVAVALLPKNRGDEQKLSTGLKKLTGEDPTFRTDRDEQTGELIAHGVSPLHLETQLHRLATNFKVEVETKIPRVPMRETVTTPSEGHHRHKKQTGGRGQFAEVYLRVIPQERGVGFEFVDATFGGSVPRNYLPAIEKGVIDQMSKGVIAGYPVVDVRVEVYDGKHHDVDSDEHSFKIAGARAFRDGFEKARPVLLEPVVILEVAVPSRFMGDINGDLNGRRGRIAGMEAIGETQVIKAQVPLKEVQTYAADLRSITQGEGSYSFEFSHYDIVPHKIQDDLVASHKAGFKEED